MNSTRELLIAGLCALGFGLAACDEAGEQSDQQGAQPPAGQEQQGMQPPAGGEPAEPPAGGGATQ